MLDYVEAGCLTSSWEGGLKESSIFWKALRKKAPTLVIVFSACSLSDSSFLPEEEAYYY
jgi:hypothetical protein